MVMRSCLMYKRSASCSTKIVATASTGKMKTQAVMAKVTMILVKAVNFILFDLLLHSVDKFSGGSGANA